MQPAPLTEDLPLQCITEELVTGRLPRYTIRSISRYNTIPIPAGTRLYYTFAYAIFDASQGHFVSLPKTLAPGQAVILNRLGEPAPPYAGQGRWHHG